MIVTCEQCGKEVTRRLSKIKGKAHLFCSRPCLWGWRRGKNLVTPEGRQRQIAAQLGKPKPGTSAAMKLRTRELNSNWGGDGVTKPAGRYRAIAICPLRDCDQCGISPSDRKMHRHHIDLNEINDDPHNIKCLCTSCHRRLHVALQKAAKVAQAKVTEEDRCLQFAG